MSFMRKVLQKTFLNFLSSKQTSLDNGSSRKNSSDENGATLATPPSTVQAGRKRTWRSSSDFIAESIEIDHINTQSNEKHANRGKRRRRHLAIEIKSSTKTSDNDNEKSHALTQGENASDHMDIQDDNEGVYRINPGFDEDIVVEDGDSEDRSSPRIRQEFSSEPGTPSDSTSIKALPSSGQQLLTPNSVVATGTSIFTPRHKQNWSSPAWTSKERLRREAGIAKFTSGWREADTKLYRELYLRSLQPSLPGLWRVDFQAWPKAIFTKTYEDAIIKARSLGSPNVNSDFHGVRAMSRLLDIGNHLRDRVAQQQAPEPGTKQTIEEFVRWTLQDAGLWQQRPYLPILVIHCADGIADLKIEQARLILKMKKLQRRWDSALEDHKDVVLPPLYGMLVAHSMVVVTAPVAVSALSRHSTHIPDGACPIRNIGIYSFSKPGQDLWNTLAIAIVAVHCRDTLLDVLEGLTLKNVEIDMDVDDPDA